MTIIVNKLLGSDGKDFAWKHTEDLPHVIANIANALGYPISIDYSTETLQTIEYEHHEIHSGSHYNYCDYSLNEASAAVIEFVLTTSNTTKWVHFVFYYDATKQFIFTYIK